jgi:hypothetical protein
MAAATSTAPPLTVTSEPMLEVRHQARIEIARLLFEDWRQVASKAKARADFPQSKSVKAVKSALALLRREAPARHRLLGAAVRERCLRGLPEAAQAELDATLGWLVERIPLALVAPDHVLRADGVIDIGIGPGFFGGPALDDETLDRLDLILDEARLAEVNVDGELGDEEDEGSWTDGRRATQLTPESGGASSRFANLGIDAGVATFAENGPSDGLGFGARPYQPWRTRERRRRPRAIINTEQVARLLAEETGRELDELRALEVRGRPTAAQRELRDQLAGAVHRLRSTNKVSAGALALVFECDPATIWRLAKAGREQAQINARSDIPIGEEVRLDAAA